VFGRLFGSKSSILPTPPKNQIEVVCPSCGAAQYEPRLVVSTFCKKCGVHLTVRKKRVTASDVTRSGVGVGINDSWVDEAPAPAKSEKPTPRDPEPVAATAPATKDDDSLSPADGFGAYLQSQAQPEAKPEEPPPPAQEPSTAQMRRPQSNSPPPTPSPALQTASSLQKMKDQGMYRNQYFKDAECFDCGHKFKTGRSAKSANCPACGAYISLEDVEINMTSTQPVKTRGNVLVRKRGRLSTSSVHCRDLECHGIIEANVTCSGDAAFRTTGTIIGEIRCQRFVIEKGADVAFLNHVHATEVEIQARVTGTIFCTGPVLIAGNGSVNGDVTARSVSIEPGGELNGAMNIVRGKSPAPAPTSVA
jgi:cytoskeletal protein CcmA (bactofilin family)/predicted  nucleic acid-binding Zn-ribbon protein